MWIAIDRFVAVVFPFKLGLISSKIRTIAIVSTWVLAGVFYFPLLITYDIVELGDGTYCRAVDIKLIFLSKESGTVYNWLHVTIRFLAPLFVITVLYTAIVISLKRKSKAIMNATQYERKHFVKKRRQGTQMAVVILALFYICVIPYTLLRFAGIWILHFRATDWKIRLLGRVYRPHCVRSVLTTSVRILPYRPTKLD